MLPRLHLFEIEDQKWFPAFLRNYMTDYLTFASDIADIYKPCAPVILLLLEKSGKNSIIDLASGAGGGWGKLAGHITKDKSDLKITLSDAFPNTDALEKVSGKYPGLFEIADSPVNALQVPAAFEGLRTMFLSFHHFTPGQAKQILQNAVDAGVPIAIFEAQQRKLHFLLPMVFSFITTLLFTPFIKPFSLKRIVFTYILPVLPVCIMWDGIASVFRTYTETEMQNMVKELKGTENYTWEIGLTGTGAAKILYLTGVKK